MRRDEEVEEVDSEVAMVRRLGLDADAFTPGCEADLECEIDTDAGTLRSELVLFLGSSAKATPALDAVGGTTSITNVSYRP